MPGGAGSLPSTVYTRLVKGVNLQPFITIDSPDP